MAMFESLEGWYNPTGGTPPWVTSPPVDYETKMLMNETATI